ncbi:hypothetical protein [Chryseolinea lacunae]|uniref:Uncharacterized protein n=1 Tax=Chryseolinea lacunae TaxID=2801331 RepID=A0ABS1KRC7_9BACT|nr:hypothetical protein [Chryseolinea lacunae]MBL0741919.1 hypothetical protein [Chryseolinea lacunae]
MKNSNLVLVSCIAVVFVLTNIVLRIFLHSDNIAMGGAIGMIGGLMSVVWGSVVIKNKNEKQQIWLTAIYAAVLFVGVFFYSSYERAEAENVRSQVRGLWVSTEQPEKDLTILFLEHDSARLWVDNEKSRFTYAIDHKQIVLTDSTGVVILKGEIERLDNENLIIRSGEFETRLKREH